MKMDREIQNICVNPLERCRDYKCKSLFADGVLVPVSVAQILETIRIPALVLILAGTLILVLILETIQILVLPFQMPMIALSHLSIHALSRLSIHALWIPTALTVLMLLALMILCLAMILIDPHFGGGAIIVGDPVM